MRCRAAVTFEYATRPPETLRLEALEATGPQTIANRAIREAKRQLRPVWWTSLVVVLERLDAAEAANEEGVEEDTDGQEDEVEGV
jgi:hypothetical protein